MTVRELVALLSGCDPNGTLVCEARSEALLLIGVRGGMHQVWPEAESLGLTVEDQDFLCALHIRNA
jgi:hypothetical protein